VIFGPNDHAALAAKEATQTIPVVGFLSPNMVVMGVIRTFARPGGNVTGVGMSWSRLSEQLFRVDKWSVCRG